MKYFLFLMTLIFLFSCEKKENPNATNHKKVEAASKVETPISSVEKSKISQDQEGEKWLKSIFHCKNNHTTFCYPDEEAVFTKRFDEFWTDALQIYGPTNFSDEELPAEEKKYEKKWGNIYPLIREEWAPFNRGNGDAEILKNVKIKPKGNLEYDVFIDFGEGYASDNLVKLIPSENSFLIDYIKTTKHNFPNP